MNAAPYHAQTTEQVLEALRVDPEQGLTPDEVRRRRETHGANRVRQSRRRSALRIWLAQFRSVVIAILAGAGILAFAFGKIPEGVAVVAVIVVNCLIGFLSEWRAARSMEALRRMGKRRVRVRRGGREQQVPSSSLVPGDVCLHEGGDMVSADLRLLEANNLQVDESPLTGESVPVVKRTDAVDADRPLTDRTDMLYRGTTITEGSAAGVVTAIGMDTELGRIARMAEEAGEEADTPLERRLNRMGQRLAWVALGAAAVVAAAGLLAGKPTLLMIETAIALGVAAIPEGLPFVATIGLARGMWLMARKKALINRLPAVETLGATTVILSDKTGTLTENRMVAAALVTPSGRYDLREGAPPEDDPLYHRCLEIGALCNNATVRYNEADDTIEDAQGDPTEIALLAGAERRGVHRAERLARKPEAREVAFDADLMMMATVHESDNAFEYAVKGAPSAVLQHCTSVAGASGERMDDERREAWNRKATELAGEGLRVLALAAKQTDDPAAEPYEELRLTGLIGLLDPPREAVRQSLDNCRRAGIRVIMVTGDQPHTARAIAGELGLTDKEDAAVLTGGELGELDGADDALRKKILGARVFARVTPKQKLKLLSLFQEDGHTAAMTGDGVNDAPALEKADIGVAMGKRGADAARESADMVLKDDAFSSILAAVRQGRIIFSNIRKAAIFMLCTNVAEVAAVGVASLLDWPLPLRPLQILYLNVLTDVFPALALSVGKGDPEKVMRQAPRPRGESVLGRPQWLAIAAWSAVISACVLAALLYAVHGLGYPAERAVTVSFLTLGFAKLWFVFNLRDRGSALLHNDIVSNRWIWTALSACALLLLAAVYVPGVVSVLETASPGARGWVVVLALSAIPLLSGQIRLAARGAPETVSEAQSNGRPERAAPALPDEGTS